MGEVVDLPVVTSLDLDPQRVLTKALESGLTEVIVIGYDADGEEYFAASKANGADVLWLLERMKMKLLKVTEILASDQYD